MNAAAARIWTRFADFIAPGAPRFELLARMLEDYGLSQADNTHIVRVGEHRHFFIPAERQNMNKGPVVLVAHYDTVRGSPGANDNGAAVFMLIEAALCLRKESLDDWLIIFTDKEELVFGEALKNQGAYMLGTAFTKTVLRHSPFYIFDCCGRGDTLVISTTADALLKTRNGQGAAGTRQQLALLRARALKAAGKSGLDRLQLLPTPFSDDAGFLRSGLAAQTLTVLPAAEAAAFASLARNTRFSPEFLVRRSMADNALAAQRLTLPETWRLINGDADTGSSLTPRSFPAITKFIRALCQR
jgi:hypothetical protein